MAEVDVRQIEVLVMAEGVAVVECKGEHDLTTKHEIADLLNRLLVENQLVVVDVSEASFVDSSFINNLFVADSFASRHGKRFRLQYGTPPTVHRVLEISGVLDKLDLAHTREEALR
jgi:anti-anti-sigma factor